MPSFRTLQSRSNLPATPGRQVKHLTSELEKKDAENETLKSSIADLTKALENMQILTGKSKALENPLRTTVTTTAVTDGEDKSKKKKKKDENAPAPAMTAYRYWSEDIKKTVVGQDKSGEQLRLMWKECQGFARQKYIEMAAEDKKRFEKENEVYQKLVTEKEAEEKALEMFYQKQKQDLALQLYEAHIESQNVLNSNKNNKKTKDPDAPKVTKSSYVFFCQEKREEIVKKNPGMSPSEIMKVLGEEWNKLEKGKGGKKGTQKYDDMAAKDKARYEKEKEAYKVVLAEKAKKMEEERQMKLDHDKEEALKMAEEKEKELLAAIAAQQETSQAAVEDDKNAKKSRKKDPNAPKKGKSAYIFFVTENREKIKAGMPEGAKQQEILTECGRQWKALSDTKRKPYAKKADKDKERYQKEMESYKKQQEAAAKDGANGSGNKKPPSMAPQNLVMKK